MKPRFRWFQRGNGVFYIEDTLTLRQESLRTKNKTVALRICQAKNAAHEQPALNLQLARTYLATSDSAVVQRIWQTALDAVGAVLDDEGIGVSPVITRNMTFRQFLIELCECFDAYPTYDTQGAPGSGGSARDHTPEACLPAPGSA